MSYERRPEQQRLVHIRRGSNQMSQYQRNFGVMTVRSQTRALYAYFVNTIYITYNHESKMSRGNTVLEISLLGAVYL